MGGGGGGGGGVGGANNWDRIVQCTQIIGDFRAEIAVPDGSERSRVASFHGAGC